MKTYTNNKFTSKLNTNYQKKEPPKDKNSNLKS